MGISLLPSSNNLLEEELLYIKAKVGTLRDQALRSFAQKQLARERGYLHLRESRYGKIHSFFFRIRIMAGVRSEDELGIKWDRCLADTGVKLLGGLTVGTVFSLVLFKRRMWPITFGMGAGFGMGYNNCERDINEPYMVHISKLKKVE